MLPLETVFLEELAYPGQIILFWLREKSDSFKLCFIFTSEENKFLIVAFGNEIVIVSVILVRLAILLILICFRTFIFVRKQKCKASGKKMHVEIFIAPLHVISILQFFLRKFYFSKGKRDYFIVLVIPT